MKVYRNYQEKQILKVFRIIHKSWDLKNFFTLLYQHNFEIIVKSFLYLLEKFSEW